jgi:osomolarity two-component system sensor histidine kinase NIK1
MSSSLADQVRSITHVTTAIARGDLTQKVEIQAGGDISTLKGMIYIFRIHCSETTLHARPGTVNSMVDQLSAFASEITRVSFEVGTQGVLGGQVKVEKVQGTWADLTSHVNVCFRSNLLTLP